MFIKKLLVVEADGADNAQIICDNAEFTGITEMAINVKLFNTGICGIFLLMHRNTCGRKQEQFHQGQCAVVRWRETEVCRIQKFPGNLKKHLPKKADCMVSYRYN